MADSAMDVVATSTSMSPPAPQVAVAPLAVLKGHEDRVWHCAWSPAGDLLASCGADKVVRIWRRVDNADAVATAWTCVETLEDTQSRTIRSCEWSPCGSYLATASFDSTTIIWQRGRKEGSTSVEWQVSATLEGPESEIKSVAWSADGTLVAVCSRDKSVWIFDAPPAAKGTDLLPDEEFELECVSVLSGHSGDVKFLAWHPTEQLLFSASYDDTIRVWAEDSQDFATTDVLQGHQNTVWGLALDPRGQRLASCSQDCTTRIWERDASGKWIAGKVLEKRHERTIFSIHWSPDGALFATCGGDDTVVLQRGDPASEFALVARVQGAHESDINCVRFSPTVAGLFATAGDDGLVKVWHMKGG